MHTTHQENGVFPAVELHLLRYYSATGNCHASGANVWERGVYAMI